jgi:hypothetical protein
MCLALARNTRTLATLFSGVWMTRRTMMEAPRQR